MKRAIVATAVISSAFTAMPATAVTVALNVVSSYDRSNAFGLAFDGSNIWWSDNGGAIHEMTKSGVDTGNNITGPNWSALAWDAASSKLATVAGGGITRFDRATTVGTTSYSALNPVFTAIAGSPQYLTDGLDIEGNTLWWSQDINNVNTSALNGGGLSSLFLAGTYSGVEYLTAGSQNFVVVVNDAVSPRQLCINTTGASLIGCTTLANNRYEDLAWDGTYLWAADYYGNRIDKISLLVNGAPIGSGTPEPAAWAMMIVGFGLVGSALRRRGVGVAAA